MQIDPQNHYAHFETELTPVLVSERTVFPDGRQGWRGLTGDGEILNVTCRNSDGRNGKPVEIPSGIEVMHNGRLAFRALPKEPSASGAIDTYETHLQASSRLLRASQYPAALAEIEAALRIAPTATARLNRAMILLALGRWPEGFEDFAYCEQQSHLFMRPNYLAALNRGLWPWRGEAIAGKRLLLLHDHGFGDTIMMLRFVPMLREMGADVVLQMPPELAPLAQQVAPVTRELIDADYVCSILLLLHVLKLAPDDVSPWPYLSIDPELIERWRSRFDGNRKHIGVAWSVNRQHDGDYPRAIPLATLTAALGKGTELVSVQQQGGAEADLLGVRNFHFTDFADCAACMLAMDEIVTIDTAALHLAGAIGHPRITALLSHWHSWRWQARLYQNVKFCIQDTPGDWESALAKRNAT